MPGGTDKPGLRFLSLGTEFAASMVGLTLFGLWIDRHFDVYPWGILIGLALGLIGGTYNLIRQVMNASRGLSQESERDDHRQE